MNSYRSICFASALFLGSSFGLIAGESTSPGVWSEPESINLPSENGPMPAIKKTCRVPNGGRHSFIDLIYYPEYKSVWIGDRMPNYFSINGAIWSAKGNGGSLLQLLGPRSVPGGQTVGEYANQWITEVIQGKIVSQGMVMFDLATIFGVKPLLDPTSSKRATALAITSIQFTNQTTVFNLQTRNGNQFQMAFSSDIQLVSASLNGRPVPVLVDGKITGSPNPWTQRKIMVQSASGPVPADACERLFLPPGAVDVPGLGKGSQPVIPYAPGFCVAVLPSGQVWSGPSKCLLALVDDQVLGFTINPQTRELLAFGGPRAPISMEPGQTAPALKKLQAQVEAAVSGGAIVPSHTIKIASLFNGDEALAKGADLSLRRLSVEDKNLVLVVRHLQGHENLTVTFTPDLKVIAAERAVGPN